MNTNQLYYGDNLRVLREEIESDSVDLVYIDPPFNSARDYFVIFKDRTGEDSSAQRAAFTDTWSWGEESEYVYRDLIRQQNRELRSCIEALRTMLGNSPMMAYLVAMAIRIVEIHRVLKPTGSFYLHCDPTASHYLKIVLDTIFSPKLFLSEVIWKRSSAHNSARRYGPIHDTLLLYSKSDKFTWNHQYTAYDEEYVKTTYRNTDDNGRRWKSSDLTGNGIRHGDSGEVWRGIDVTAKGRHWMYTPAVLDQLDGKGLIYWPQKTGGVPRLKQYLDEMPGVPVQDVFDDIPPVGAQAMERLGYPTQKPLALLQRIIAASSNPGDVVLDAFCGCGTTIHAAHDLQRQWIGIDITSVACGVIKSRMELTFKAEGLRVPVVGFPVDFEGARTLFENDPYEFQAWACSLIDAYPRLKKGSDKGIDGDFPFFDYREKPQNAVVQIKGGKVTVSQIRDLVGTVEREKAALGFFVCLEKPTKPMLDEARSAGIWDAGGEREYPRIQIMSVADLLSGQSAPRIPPQEKRSMLGYKAAGKARSSGQTTARLSTINGQAELNLE